MALFDDDEMPISVEYGPPPAFYDDEILVTPGNIIFDFGGVLMKHNLSGCRDAFRAFMDDDAIYHVLGLGNENPRGTLIDRYNRGLSTDLFTKEVLKYCKPDTRAEDVLSAWNMLHDHIPDETWDQIRSLRLQGYRTYLLSNTNSSHWRDTIMRYGEQIRECFDDVFLSFEMHCAKPDEHIYREVDLAIGSDSERTIFVDDTLANRAAAAKYVQWETCPDMESLLAKIESWQVPLVKIER